jgi:diphthamide biosynthesis protein 2
MTITLFKLQLGSQPTPTWTGKYVLNFDHVLMQESCQHSWDKEDEDGDPDQTVFSLVMGKYRHAKHYKHSKLLQS